MIRTLLANPHTSASAVVYLVGKAVSQVLPSWLPQHTAQLQTTGEWLSWAAVTYGLLKAGDAKRPVDAGGDKPHS